MPARSAAAVPLTADAFGLVAGGGHWSTPRMLPQSPPTQSTPEGEPLVFLISCSMNGSREGLQKCSKQVWCSDTGDCIAGGLLPFSGGNWLITGGMGGLGVLFAHWAAANHAAHLHLVDIQVPGSLPEALVGPGSGLGAVTITRSDIGRADDAAQAVRSCGGASHTGIIHAAGLLQVRF